MLAAVLPQRVDVGCVRPGVPDDGDDDLEDVDESHDPFMAELRRAVTDEEPLGPRDDDAKSFATSNRRPRLAPCRTI